MHIWQKIKKEKEALAKKADISIPEPIIVLAPMADVTDASFRFVIAECGKPDMLWTEFVSADGLIKATPEGKNKLLRDLLFDPQLERPIVAQLFGSNPETMEEAAYLVANLGFDGIDINMGCPDRSIEKQGAGAGMIKNPKRAQEIVLAAKRGAKRAFDEGAFLTQGRDPETINEPIPVSVKTRIGYNKNELQTWIPALLETKPALITVHARTRKEMSLVPARWEHVAEAVAIRDQVQADLPLEERTLIFGNGDATSAADGIMRAKNAGADGAMLGRAIFGNPWLFYKDHSNPGNFFKEYIPTLEEKLNMAIKHTELFAEKLGDIKNFAIMKKHFKAYINGFDNAKELRMELMEKAENAQDVKSIIEAFMKNNTLQSHI